MNETIPLTAVAKLLGRLLICEIDRALAAELTAPEVGDSLQVLGIDVSLLAPENLDELAADYFDAMVNPDRHPPLVQSLCQDGRYESAAAASVREIAASAGVELDQDLARGAPPDHLGVQLLLWSELVERSSSAGEFAERHLVWALRPLEPIAASDGFYGSLAAVVIRFIGVITTPPILPSTGGKEHASPV